MSEEPTASELLALAADNGIRVLSVPTPFAVGPVNCYLIEGEPLTLIDTGPNTGTALDMLASKLGELGYSLQDLELIVLTHQHADHLGLVDILVSRSGAEIAAIAPLASWMQDYARSQAADDAFAQEVMRRHGIPDDFVTVLGSVGAAFRPYGSSGNATHVLTDGDELKLGDRALKVLHTPGHSPTDTIFWDEERGILLAGDHLLKHISSNALVARPPVGDTHHDRPTPLLSYIESMQRTRELPARIVLGGHGDPIGAHVQLIDERLRLHDRRARKLLSLIEPAPISGYEIAVQMWGNIAVTQAFLTLSEVLGHVDLLIQEGKVRERDDGEIIRFEATSAA